MKEINRKYYDEGDKIFEKRYTDAILESESLVDEWNLYFEMIERIADSAYYCDGYGAKNLSEAYFVIVEVFGIEEGNEWLAERIDTEEMLGAVA